MGCCPRGCLRGYLETTLPAAHTHASCASERPSRSQNLESPQIAQACRAFPRQMQFPGGAFQTFRATGDISNARGQQQPKESQSGENPTVTSLTATSPRCAQISLRPNRLSPEWRDDVLYYLSVLFVCIKRLHLHG